MDLLSRWPIDGATEVRDRMVAAYGDPRRTYHDLTHLTEVLDHVDLLHEEADDLVAVRLAAWFHDAVHEGSPDDEERSALLAEQELTAAGVDGARVGEVVRLVRLTRTHAPEDGDRDGAVLSDADLAILAAAPERYAAYTAGVRAEYAHVPDDDFRRGRADVLRALVAAPRLFRTARGRDLWERSARANVAAELARLDPRPPPA